MKFKLVQFTILLVFVMSIIFLAHTPNGFGHGASEHPPEFYVSYWTGSYVGTTPTHMYDVDPRSYTSYSGSSGNGTESASSWALKYYASGLISGDHADDKEIEMVYGAEVNLSASAGTSSCSGSVSPGITDHMGLTASHEGWSGRGQIVLTISEKKDALYLAPLVWIYTRIDVKESKFDTGPEDIRIEVQSTNITNTESVAITGTVSYGPASGSASLTTSAAVEREGVLYAYTTGITASLPVSFWLIAGAVDSQLTKSASVSGNLGGTIEPSSIDAEFNGKDYDSS